MAVDFGGSIWETGSAADPNAPPSTVAAEILPEPAVTGQGIIIPLLEADSVQFPAFSPRLVAGAYVGDFNAWFMDQFWLFPTPLDYGRITSDKALSMEALNTHRNTTRALLNIDTAALAAVGVTQTGGNPTPIILNFFHQESFEFTAGVDGPATFDVLVEFDFDQNQTSLVRFLGIRLVLFNFVPDQPVPEQLSWFTDIFKAKDGNEQRQGLRTTPRQRLQYIFSRPEDSEMARLRNTLFTFRGFTFGFGIWFEQKTVGQAELAGQTLLQVVTKGMDLRIDSTILIFEPVTRAFQDREVASFTPTTITLTSGLLFDMSARAVVAPVRFGGITRNPRFNDQRTGWMRTSLEFTTDDNASQAYADQTALEVDWTVHPEDGLVILVECNIMRGAAQSRAVEAKLIREDPGIGIPLQLQVHPTADFRSQKRTFDLFTNTEILRWRQLLHWWHGSLASFYLPTFRNDLIVTTAFQLDNTVLTIENQGLDALVALQGAHKSIMLTVGETQYFAEIASVFEASETLESITLLNPFDAMDATLIQPADAMVSWLELTRMEGDVATFTHQHAGRATLEFNTRTIQQ